MKKGELQALVEQAGVRPSRTHGQNFLIDENLARAIARDGLPDDARGDLALEIGTGPALLTEHLSPLAAQVVTVELDRGLAALARRRLADRPNVTLVETDALDGKHALHPLVLEALAGRLKALPDARVRVVANLPYAVATPLVVQLLGADLPLGPMVVMVQLEAAQRFAAGPEDDAYGSVSVLCRAACESVTLVRRVPPDVFWPRPKVTSAVVRFVPRADRRAGRAALEAVTRGLFGFRRKTIARAAREAARADPSLGWLEAAVAASGLDPRSRPEALDVAQFRRIAGFAPGGHPAEPPG